MYTIKITNKVKVNAEDGSDVESNYTESIVEKNIEDQLITRAGISEVSLKIKKGDVKILYKDQEIENADAEIILKEAIRFRHGLENSCIEELKDQIRNIIVI